MWIIGLLRIAELGSVVGAVRLDGFEHGSYLLESS